MLKFGILIRNFRICYFSKDMPDDTKQTKTKNQTLPEETSTSNKVSEEAVSSPAWIRKTEPQVAKTTEVSEVESQKDLPAWVKNANAGKDTPKYELETEKEETDEVSKAETPEEPKAGPTPREAQKKQSIFDNFKELFSISEKKRADLVKQTVQKTEASKAKGQKSTITPEEKKRLMEAEKLYQEGLSSIRDLIAPSSMDIEYDKLRVEGMYAQSFYVYAYPRYLDANWLSPVINYDVSMHISQFIYPIDSGAIMKVLKRKVAQMQSAIRIAQDKGNVRDPAIETALEDAEQLRTEIQRGQEKFFQLGLYFTVFAEDKKKLTKVAKQMETLLGGKLVLTKKADFQMEHAFNTCLPICSDELETTLNMNTSPLSTMFPFNSAELTSNKGILYGLNRHNDSLIIFDRFSLENANSVVFAKSGAGKSYAVKLEILRSLMFGTDVIIIDPEKEYLELCNTVGGAYMDVSLNADRRINPFDLPAPLKDEVVQPGDLLRANIISLHGLLKIMLGGVTPEEEGMLDKALTDVYALRGITMEIEDPSSFPAPTMGDLYDILNSMEGARNLAVRLAKYTQGTYAGIFNKPTNVDLSSGLVVFSIRDLEDALRPIAMYIILNFIWNKVRSSLKKRLLVIDEAWSLMQHDDSANFLYGLVKRARKYYLGVTTITQDVEDFVNNKFGKPIITNSSMQLLLKQAPAALDMLQKIFNLTEGEKYMLLNSGIGQGLFFAGTKHVAIQVIASYGEDKLVTTNPEEMLRAEAEEVVYGAAEESAAEAESAAETASEPALEETPKALPETEISSESTEAQTEPTPVPEAPQPKPTIDEPPAELNYDEK